MFESKSAPNSLLGGEMSAARCKTDFGQVKTCFCFSRRINEANVLGKIHSGEVSGSAGDSKRFAGLQRSIL